MGDFVLTGGEIAAMAVADAVCRMIPGVLSAEECFSEESHFSGMLEYPQYSRPAEYMGRAVPDILLGGHHANIVKWRRQKSLERTLAKRPDMLITANLTNEDKLYLKEYISGNKAFIRHLTPVQKAKLTRIINSAIQQAKKSRRKHSQI
jgi:tRNA (guanine37-N1)-methyltransferase